MGSSHERTRLSPHMAWCAPRAIDIPRAQEQAPRAMTTSAHCHKLIAETAQAMAHEVYDALMQRNDWYAGWKRQNPGAGSKALESRWVKRTWGTYIASARAQLASMLARNDVSEEMKEQIMEALVLDSSLIRGRANPKQILGAIN